MIESWHILGGLQNLVRMAFDVVGIKTQQKIAGATFEIFAIGGRHLFFDYSDCCDNFEHTGSKFIDAYII